jgi:hypothetical protein
MKMQIRLLLAAALLGPISMASAADITGKVTLKGTPRPEQVIPMDPSCAKLHEGKERPRTRFYLTAPDGGLADVFVYIREGLEGKKFDPPTEPAVLDQVDCEYVPYIMGAQIGQKIVVKNSDPLFHNVHPTPRTPGNREYNRAHLAGAPDLEFVWDKPEIFLRFKCDVHPWMFSYVSLVEHPFYAVTNEKGEFKISGLPPGDYVIEAVHRRTHPDGKGITQEITVGETAQKVDFTIELK